MPLKRAVTEFGKTYKDRFALRTYPGTSVPIFIFILGWSRTKPRVTLSAQTMNLVPDFQLKFIYWHLAVSDGHFWQLAPRNLKNRLRIRHLRIILGKRMYMKAS